MKASIFCLALLLTVATVFSKQISFQNCPDSQEHGEITSIDLTPCDQDPCVLKMGNNETVTINFIPHEVVTAATINAYAIFGTGEEIPLPVPDPDACEAHGLSCPLKSGVQVEFVYTIYLSPDFPSGIALKLKVDFRDQNDASLICGIVNLQLV